jgi:hypothetical protein
VVVAWIGELIRSGSGSGSGEGEGDPPSSSSSSSSRGSSDGGLTRGQAELRCHFFHRLALQLVTKYGVGTRRVPPQPQPPATSEEEGGGEKAFSSTTVVGKPAHNEKAATAAAKKYVPQPKRWVPALKAQLDRLCTSADQHVRTQALEVVEDHTVMVEERDGLE